MIVYQFAKGCFTVFQFAKGCFTVYQFTKGCFAVYQFAKGCFTVYQFAKGCLQCINSLFLKVVLQCINSLKVVLHVIYMFLLPAVSCTSKPAGPLTVCTHFFFIFITSAL